MNYKTVKQGLDEVYGLISSIPVKGDGAESMAAARLQLRSVYQQIETSEKDSRTENVEE